MSLNALTSLDSPVIAMARRVKVGRGRFGWWVGTLRRINFPRHTVWFCGHQHSTRTEARECVSVLVYALKGS